MVAQQSFPQVYPQPEYRAWSAAMEQALYGPAGFYRGQGVPARHFRTSAHASPLFAAAVVRLLRSVDAALGEPAELTLTDLGAGGGELLAGVAALVHGDPLAARLRLVAVDVAHRPGELDQAVSWRAEPPRAATGLLIANEWLDNVPCDVAEHRGGRWRSVEVAVDGAERPGPAVSAAQGAWLERWWPGGQDGDRAEIGLNRDEAWRNAVSTLERGVAVAVDYSHRCGERPPGGTLTGYARGRQVAPVPDGNCDITAHVALDACAAAAGAKADWTVSTSQREVLRRLGVSGARPPLALAGTDPAGYIRALSQASSAAELADPGGLGGFGWLIQGVDVRFLPEWEDWADDGGPGPA